MEDGRIVERWEELRGKWKYWIPTAVVDSFIYDLLRESKKEYPNWEECVNDRGDEALLNHIKKLGRWIFKYWWCASC